MDKKNNIYIKTIIASISSIIEVLGGQPIDRWKINSQMLLSDKLSFNKLLFSGSKNMYAGLKTSLIYNSLFYFPSIYALDTIWNNKYKENDGIIDNINKCLFVSSLISPVVSCFENIKTEQQVNNLRDKTMTYIIKKRYNKYGIVGIIPSYYSTFYRESIYCGGLLILSPIISKKIKTNNSYMNNCVGGALAGLISQVISQPFDTIKTRQEKYKKGMVDIIKSIIRNENIKTFWDGCVPRCIRGMWSVSCMSIMFHYFSENFNL
tara:strand:- start:3334 stop:4125 length:792 start_codon:yes stop_codon:yes gene_type:complete